MTDEPLDLAAYEARHPLARNGLCALHQGDNGPCEATALLAEVKRLRAQLAQPCGSCHPCTEWANQTWINAGLRLPHVYEWTEMRAERDELRAQLKATNPTPEDT